MRRTRPPRCVHAVTNHVSCWLRYLVPDRARHRRRGASVQRPSALSVAVGSKEARLLKPGPRAANHRPRICQPLSLLASATGRGLVLHRRTCVPSTQGYGPQITLADPATIATMSPRPPVKAREGANRADAQNSSHPPSSDRTREELETAEQLLKYHDAGRAHYGASSHPESTERDMSHNPRLNSFEGHPPGTPEHMPPPPRGSNSASPAHSVSTERSTQPVVSSGQICRCVCLGDFPGMQLITGIN